MKHITRHILINASTIPVLRHYHSGVGKPAPLLVVVRVAVPEVSDLPGGVLGARPLEHLRVDPDPLVGDPLAADHDGAAAVPRQHVVAARAVHVPPEHHGALPRPDVRV